MPGVLPLPLVGLNRLHGPENRIQGVFEDSTARLTHQDIGEMMFSEYVVNSPALEYLTKLSALSNTVIFFITLVFAGYQVHQMKINRHHSNLSNIFSRNSDLNKRTEDDKYRRKAAEQFVPHFRVQEASGKTPNKPEPPEDEERLYWGTRAYLMDLITMILQVWLLADKPKNMKGDFTGWQVVAKAVSDEIRGVTYISKPGWYTRACDDILKYMQAGRIYPPDFLSWMAELSNERKITWRFWRRRWIL